MITIGTSGFVYPTNRKGEHLIGRLNKETNYNVIAAGKGWPCSTKYYDDISQFYRKLDVYVSTSNIEGIGYGVLEALSHGIPVIVPKGVGVYDQIMHCENIYRYEVNNYDDLLTQIRNFEYDYEHGHINKASLIASVSRFTVENWLNDHTRIFSNLVYLSNFDEPQNKLSNNVCVVYVAYGDKARECATIAMESFKRYLPEIDVVFISDSPLGIETLYIDHPDTDIGARSVKTKIDQIVPEQYEYILYLDSDTEIVSGDIITLYKLLEDGWEFVMCYNPEKYALVKDMYRPDNQVEMDELIGLLGSERFLQLNGGVFAYRRNTNTQQFMNRWFEEWNKYGGRDQSAFDRVYYNQSLRLFVLGIEWNTVTRYYNPKQTAGILHYPMSARRWTGKIHGRLDSKEAWERVE